MRQNGRRSSLAEVLVGKLAEVPSMWLRAVELAMEAEGIDPETIAAVAGRLRTGDLVADAEAVSRADRSPGA
jgi:hypothetical protein